jgi:hypothetical protein
MSTTEERSSDASGAGSVGADMKLEVVVIPVSDADRAKEFYGDSGGGSTPTLPATTPA